MKQIKQKKIIIIGAGYGGIGLAKSLSLKEDKFKVSLFERDDSKTSRSQGYTIGIQQEGINCLFEKLNFSESASLFSKNGPSDIAIYSTFLPKYPVLKIKNVIKVKIKEEKVSGLIDRTELRSSMIDQLPKTVDINFGKKFEKYEENEEGVTVYFSDGTKVEGDILIGADGANSLVRKQRCSELIPEDLDFWSSAGTINISEKEVRELAKKNYIVNQSINCLCRKAGSKGCSLLTFYDNSAGKTILIWSISMSSKVAKEYGMSSQLSKEELKKKNEIISDDCFDLFLSQIIRLTPTSQIFEGYRLFSVNSNILKLNPLSKNKNSRVTLIGDAAHKTTTHGGLGVTQALLDVISLSDNLISSSNLIDGLRNYEIEMCKRATSAVNTSVGMTKRIHQSNPVINFLFFCLMFLIGLIIRLIQLIF